MKKRMLVLLAFGISFAPPVFAAEGVQARAGEMKLSQIDLRGARCDQRDSKKLGSEGSEGSHERKVETNSRGTRSGRAAD